MIPVDKASRMDGAGGEGPTVLVVDDDDAIRAALDRGLVLEGFRVVTVGDGRSALTAIEARRPGAVVLDLGLPDLDGVEVLRRLRGAGDDVPVCILSARTELDDRIAGLQAGADDYLVKPFALGELIARLHALLRRRPDAGPIPVRVGNLLIDPLRRRATLDGTVLDLTRREFDLLEVLARNAGIVLDRIRLLELVWGYDFDVDTNVVDVFVGYLRRKLESGGAPRMLHTVRGVGFALRP
ncbi:response regulator transcription factor [soil metagenome]